MERAGCDHAQNRHLARAQSVSGLLQRQLAARLALACLVDRDAVVASGITINGLSIEAEERALHDYYRARVIIGADSFVEPAEGFEDIARAMKAKLVRELRPLGS